MGWMWPCAVARAHGASLQVALEQFATLPYPADFQQRLRAISQPTVALEELTILHAELARHHAASVLACLAAWQVSPARSRPAGQPRPNHLAQPAPPAASAQFRPPRHAANWRRRPPGRPHWHHYRSRFPPEARSPRTPRARLWPATPTSCSSPRPAKTACCSTSAALPISPTCRPAASRLSPPIPARPTPCSMP